MRVLVAEHDAGTRGILKETVKRFGHECLVAKDGLEAWKLYQNTHGVEVVISDCMVPRIDGPELCRRIRRIDRTGYTFFIFMEPTEDKELSLTCMRAGADDYLTKPLDSEQLRARLLTASRIMSLRQRLNAQGKDEVKPGGNNEIALRDARRLLRRPDHQDR